MGYRDGIWKERYIDIDLTKQGAQTFSSDTQYTFGGYTWTRINSGTDTTSMNLDGSTGLIITPGSTNQYGVGNTRQTSAMLLPITNVIPHAHLGMGLRIWAYNSSNNAAAGGDYFGMIVEQPTASPSTTSNQMAYTFKRGFDTSAAFVSAITLGAANTFSTADDTSEASTDNVLVLEIPRLGVPKCLWYSGAWSNGWPAFKNLHHRFQWANGTANRNMRSDTGVFSQWNIGLFAQRNGTGTALVTKCAQFRVDVLFY